MALDRKCIVCPDKHHYKYCSNCSGYNSKETWRFLFCGENCRGIYDIATRFVSGKITGLQAKKELKNFDLSDLENISYYRVNMKIGDVYQEIDSLMNISFVVTATESNPLVMNSISSLSGKTVYVQKNSIIEYIK
mgnify:CR=1 FL=1